jgi:iron complex transport system substrate-binding protein
MLGTMIALVASDAARAVDIADQRGRTVTFHKLPERLVFIPIPAPSTFIAIDGSERKIVGMNDYSARAMHEGILGKLFPGFAKIQTNMTLGGDPSNFAPNVEAVLALRPDAVFQWASSSADFISALDRTGVAVLGMRVGSYENYVDYVKLMGKVAGKEERTALLLGRQDEMRQRLAALLADLQPAQRPSVLYFNRAQNLLRVSGKGTFQDFNIQLAGGQNAAAGSSAIATITIEQVMTWNPEVILLGNFDARMPSDLYDDPRWQGIDAVKNRRVYRMPLGGYRWDPPSHESALTWLWLAGLLQPERMRENFRETMRDWFGFLYNHELTDEEIDGILFVKENGASAGYERYQVR